MFLVYGAGDTSRFEGLIKLCLMNQKHSFFFFLDRNVGSILADEVEELVCTS